ncbi:MAG: hypothetical protein JKY82_03760 [Rhizobiaceae bacterium]|nr:hypothetical protein [Rhizobiaceae bacterium]MBL4731700.1 hypothetical protein [Rhizobiaceae bacterium]
MENRFSQFLGDTPGRTLVKLAVISFVVGIIMSALNFTPIELWYAIEDFFRKIYELGFDAVWRIARYFVWGALFVVPVFVLLRLFRIGK